MHSVFRFPIRLPVLILILAAGLACAAPKAAAAPDSPTTCIIYVNINAPSGGNGSSWAAANPSLIDAILAAAANCEIWVAKGTYLPKGSSRLGSFFLIDNLAIYGGFAGTETSRSQRNWAVNVTTLSGDIFVPGNSSDNSYNVVYSNYNQASAVLDGFTITGGNANSTASGYIYGGGIESIHSSATLANLNIVQNQATYGGGFDCNGGSPSLTNSTFDSNRAEYGAGFYSFNACQPTLSHVAFYNNAASSVGSDGGDGGALYADQTSGTLALSDALIIGNAATHAGGGLYDFKARANLARVRFEFNFADFGAGLIIDTNTSSTLVDSSFTGNQASSKGGGLYLYGSSPTLTNVYFASNTAVSAGGGLGGYTSSPILTNVTFYGNSALYGGGIYNSQASHPQVRNSILWADTGGEVFLDPSPNFTASTITLTYSLAQGCNPGGVWNTAQCGPDGGHNLVDADPRFVSPAGENFRLQYPSPAVNTGSNAFVAGVPSDKDGRPRIRSGIVDLGPYERQFVQVFLPVARR
jgi:hypothetical protein